jgi:RHS repeat-associated protein
MSHMGEFRRRGSRTYDPELKFSGKPHDAESGLDYFGARYYDHSLYRFLSVDPVTTHIGYLSQTHAWNLYVYCGNNPLINIDQSGKWFTRVHYNVTYAAMMMAFKDWDPTFAQNLAHTVASACAGVDTDPSTTSKTKDRKQRKMWHFPDGNRYAEALDIALSTLNPIEFGKALHVIQDYFSHNRYDSDHVIDTAISQLGMGDDPDNPLHFWDAALAMAYLTLDLCYAYEQRLSAVVSTILVFSFIL